MEAFQRPADIHTQCNDLFRRQTQRCQETAYLFCRQSWVRGQPQHLPPAEFPAAKFRQRFQTGCVQPELPAPILGQKIPTGVAQHPALAPQGADPVQLFRQGRRALGQGFHRLPLTRRQGNHPQQALAQMSKSVLPPDFPNRAVLVQGPAQGPAGQNSVHLPNHQHHTSPSIAKAKTPLPQT